VVDRWRRLKLIIKVIEVRLRFLAVLLVTGLVIGYWDTLANYWERWTRPGAAPVLVARDSELFCPMHPSVVRASLEPGGEIPKCPICGMPLSVRKKASVAPLPPNVTGRVQLSPDRIRLGGIRTEEVAPRPLVMSITTVGNVTYDESGLSRIVARASGYLEKLFVSETFTTVACGDALAEIYSPDLYTATQELILSSKGSASPELAKGAREKLRLLGVAEQEIDSILASEGPSSRIVLRSPQSGHVIHRAVVLGAHVNAGDTLFEIADLSRVWIEAEVYERDIPFLVEGQSIEATVVAFPARVFSGTVSLVHPHLSTETRTNQVRFVLENPHHELRPGMFATVRIERPVAEGGAGEVLSVPERAVIDTGSKKIVYVEREPGLFEGVRVELGHRVGGFYPVVSGLQAGERVAATGAFLVDAETRLSPGAGSTFLGAAGSEKGR